MVAVALFTGALIEISTFALNMRVDPVALFTGALIEIL